MRLEQHRVIGFSQSVQGQNTFLFADQSYSPPLLILSELHRRGAWSPIWSLPHEFLTGFSAAAGIAFINSVGNLGGFIGPYAMGAINEATGNFHGGLVFAGILWFISAMLLIALPKRGEPQAVGVATET